MVKTGRNQITALLLVLCLALMAAKCSDDKLRNLARADDDIAQSLHAAILAKREIAKENKITPAEELQLTKALYALNESAQLFHAQVKQASSLDPSTKAAITTAFDDLVKSIGELEQAGVIEIKDPAAKEKFRGIVASLNAAAGIIRGLIG